MSTRRPSLIVGVLLLLLLVSFAFLLRSTTDLPRDASPQSATDSPWSDEFPSNVSHSVAEPSPVLNTSITINRTDRMDNSIYASTAGGRLGWVPGGVRGPDVFDVEASLDDMFLRNLVSRHEAKELVDQGLLLHLLERLSVELADEISNPAEGPASDCLFHLLPHQRATCLLAAFLEDDDRLAPLYKRNKTWTTSYCRAAVPCLLWGRGHFTRNITPTRLRETFRSVHYGKTTTRSSAAPAVDKLVRSLFVQAHSRSPDFRRVNERLSVHEEIISRKERLLDELFLAKRRGWGGKVPKELLPPNVSNLFHNHSIVYSASRGGRIFIRENPSSTAPAGGSSQTRKGPFAYVTPLEALSILHHHCDRRHNRSELGGASPTAGGMGRRQRQSIGPHVSIIAFSGDSMVREMFMRLIHFLRFGDPTKYPAIEASQVHDMLYSVYPSHDELQVFHSSMSNPSSRFTIEDFFSRLQSGVDETGERLLHKREPALVHVAYYWNPKTAEYRTDLLATHRQLSESITRHRRAIVDSTYPLATAQRPLLLVRQPKAPLGAVVNQQPAALPVGIMTVGGQQKRNVFVNGGGGVMQFLAPAPGTGKGTKGKVAMNAMQEAIRSRSLLPSNLRGDKQGRMVIPLRKFGVGISVHLMGHVFWECRHNEKLFQQLAAEALSMVSETTGENGGGDDDLAGENPDDETDTYVMSASLEDKSEPQFRRLLRQALQSSRLFTGGASANNVNESMTTAQSQQRVHYNLLAEVDDHDSDDPDALINQQPHKTAAAPEEGGVSASPLVLSNSIENLTAPNAGHRFSETIDEAAVEHEEEEPYAWKHAPGGINECNLHKNKFLLRWVRKVMRMRESNEERFWEDRRQKKLSTNASRGKHDDERRQVFRFIRSLSLFDLSKLQLLGFHQGDPRHFSCRFSQIQWPSMFEKSFSEMPMRLLVHRGSFLLDREVISSRHGLTVDWLVLALTHRLFGNSNHKAHIRRRIHRLSGLDLLKTTRRQEDDFVLHVLNRVEYGLLMHDDFSGCNDHANLFAIQLLLSDLARKVRAN